MRKQRIERRWAREWREDRYVTPKYMKKFALNPPCPRPPLAPGQIADPTSLKRGEDYPDEWAKRQAKLAKQAKEAVRKFNEALLLLQLPLLRPLLSSQRRLCQRSLRISQVLHLQCPQGQVPQQCPRSQIPQSPHDKFLMLLLFLQSPQLLRQSLQLFRLNPQHLCILPRVKGLPASSLP